MGETRAVVIGAGIGGLSAALDLAAHGYDVTIIERADAPGGKVREIDIGGSPIDAGPTVFTMRWVFDALFADAGLEFAEHVALERATTLARHAWVEGGRLDLHADLTESAEAIGAFAGPAEARRYLEFAARARAVYRTLERPFMRSACAGPLSLVRAIGLRGLGDLWRIAPFETLWRALRTHFHDARLQQLFGRYATYCGSSPFQAPATLMLVAHVEQEGVWLVAGGMHRLARAIAAAAQKHGARLRLNTEVASIASERGVVSGVTLRSGERVAADVVVVNADTAAVAQGLFGNAVTRGVPKIRRSMRSLSALTWTLSARSEGFPLHRHNVFFSSGYAREFDEIFRHSRVPAEPTVYVCAQDRGNRDDAMRNESERLLCLINAPADGDTHRYDSAEIRSCEIRTFDLLRRCGLMLEQSPQMTRATSPSDFERLFPATGGALYGPASHGWRASFNRMGSRSPIKGLYFAGGSTHPGPGVPMAALSGRLAAASILADSRSIATSHPAVTRGGMSTV